MAGRRLPLLGVAALALGCATIDVNNTVTIRQREAPPRQFGGEQLVSRDFVADYVQLGPRLLVEIRELETCAVARHVPVLRVEDVHRSNRNFVIWDFTLGLFTGGFAALAFAQPQIFSAKLVDGDGRVVYDKSSAYLVGGIFAAISAGLLSAGIVDAVRSRDETRYADAYEVELGSSRPCANTLAAPLADRDLRLVLGDAELEAHTNATGRARFALPTIDPALVEGATLDATIEIIRADRSDIEDEVLVIPVRVPFDGMVDAHTGVVDTRTDKSIQARGPEPTRPEPDAIEFASPVEGPEPPESP